MSPNLCHLISTSIMCNVHCACMNCLNEINYFIVVPCILHLHRFHISVEDTGKALNEMESL